MRTVNCGGTLPDTIKVQHCAIHGNAHHIQQRGKWVCKDCTAKPLQSRDVAAYLANRRRAIESHYRRRTTEDYWGDLA